MYLGLDIGFGWTKVAYAKENGDGMLYGRCQRYPSAIAPVLKQATFLDYAQETRLLEYRGEHFLVGEAAARSAMVMCGRDIEFLATYAPLLCAHALLKLAPEPSGNMIGVGLPPADYRRHKEAFQSTLGRITIGGQALENCVSVFPQGAVAIVEWVQTHGDLKNIILVDIGHNTLDVVPVRNGLTIPDESASISRGGICIITDRLVKVVRNEWEFTLNGPEAAEALRCGVVKKYGEEIDLTKTIRTCVEQYAVYLDGILKEQWGEHLKKVDRIVFLGGGANLIERHLPDRYRKIVKVMPQPEYVNARGYLWAIARGRRITLGR